MKMETLFVFALVALAVPLAAQDTGGVSVNTTFPVLVPTGADAQELQERYDALNASAATVIVEMDAVAGLAQESDAAVADELQGDLQEFRKAWKDADNAAEQGDEQSFEGNVTAARGYVQKFRNATAGAFAGDMQRVRDRVRERLANNSKLLSALNNTAWTHAKKAALLSFDMHYRNAEGFVNRTVARLSANNMTDFSESTALLSQIWAKRSELEAAFDAGDKAAVKRVQEEINDLYGQLRSAALLKAQKFARAVIERANRTIQRLESRGVNVSGVAEKLAVAEKIVSVAESQCVNVSRAECGNKIREAVREQVQLNRQQRSQALNGDAGQNQTVQSDDSEKGQKNKSSDADNETEPDESGNGKGHGQD